jgi:hypothetical protein
LAEANGGRDLLLLFCKSACLPLGLWLFITMYARCLSDLHSEDISTILWGSTMNQDDKGQPQQGDQNNKTGQQGQQPGQNPGQQQTQQPGKDANKT